MNLPALWLNPSPRGFHGETLDEISLTRVVAMSLIGLAISAPAFAQANSPRENAVNVLQQAFTSTIARGLSLVAIVVSGLTFAFGEGGSKRVLAAHERNAMGASNHPVNPSAIGLSSNEHWREERCPKM